MIRVLIYDDRDNVRRSLRHYFADSSRVFITQDYPHADNAVKHVTELQPDVVLMDIDMPHHISGIEALQNIKIARPQTKVMMLTIFEDEDKIFASLRSGASGYALKNIDNDDTLDALEQAVVDVNNGGGYMSPIVAAKVMGSFQGSATQTHYVALTDRQKAVLSCMVKGLSRKMIAGELDIKSDTVSDHIKEIYKKLHVNSASEAVREAILRDIV